ncbi:MAG: porin family protein [Candidatus Kapabacteria bacterium]|jgi:hypothetical protein|nr:porin family protein [Candidatus Kapabacteria bacterium]
MNTTFSPSNVAKRSLFLAFAAMIMIVSVQKSSAQFGPNANFKNKDLFVGAHLGLGGGWYSGFGPVVNVEYGVLPQLGVTASAGFFSYTDVYSTYSWTYTSIPIIIGANWHFDLLKVKQLDTWVGAGAGYTFGSWSSSDPDRAYRGSVGSYFSWDGRLGARYYFTDKLAAKLELGYWSLGYLRLGVDFKL